MTDVLKGKTIDRICSIALAAMLLITAAVWAGKAAAGKQSAVAMGYEGLFDTGSVHTIDIEMADWDGFITNVMLEEYAECSVTIDGEKLSNVGIRAKGNTSLSSVASENSRKYSFKLEFDHFVKGKTYRGLDKMSLNNLIYDATMMKDYLAYTLMGKMGVPSPLCSYVQITVNGEPWGLFLAVEGVENSFLERNNMTKGELYKPDSLSFGGGRGNGRDFDFEQFRVKEEDSAQTESSAQEGTADAAGSGADSSSAAPSTFPSSFGSFPGQGNMTPPQGFSASEGFSMPEGMTPPAGFSVSEGFQMPDGMKDGSPTDGKEGFGGMFNFGMGSSDVKLQYTDDETSSYSNIFDNAKTEVGKKDKARLIQTLKTLNGENAQDAVFADEVIRYLAVHDFLQNDDSYTGMMVHNYYLYEENGKLAIIPWDYNLAFGGMGAGGSASATVNSPIDSPVSNGSVGDRPLIAWIFEDEEALAQYHEVYGQFVSEIIESGWLENEIARVAALIRPYVAADENSFYTAEEFDAAVETLQSYCVLRGESIRGQLEGAIPSTSQGQSADSSGLVEVGSLTLSVMGTMNTGGGNGQGGPTMPGNGFPGGSFGSFSGNFPTQPGLSDNSGKQSAAAENGADAAAGEASLSTTLDPTASPLTSEQTEESKIPTREGFSFPEGINRSGTADDSRGLIVVLCLAVLFAGIVLAALLPGKER